MPNNATTTHTENNWPNKKYSHSITAHSHTYLSCCVSSSTHSMHDIGGGRVCDQRAHAHKERAGKHPLNQSKRVENSTKRHQLQTEKNNCMPQPQPPTYMLIICTQEMIEEEKMKEKITERQLQLIQHHIDHLTHLHNLKQSAIFKSHTTV